MVADLQIAPIADRGAGTGRILIEPSEQYTADLRPAFSSALRSEASYRSRLLRPTRSATTPFANASVPVKRSNSATTSSALATTPACQRGYEPDRAEGENRPPKRPRPNLGKLVADATTECRSKQRGRNDLPPRLGADHPELFEHEISCGRETQAPDEPEVERARPQDNPGQREHCDRNGGRIEV